MTWERIWIEPVGVLRTGLRSLDVMPKNYTESDLQGVIEILAPFRPAMEGIRPGQIIIVLWWMHRAARDVLQVHPRGDRGRPKRGVFATRSPARPNPVGISELLVEAVDDLHIVVRGVDVLDGTPVIDIKKRESTPVR